jgi:hypothetical protein
MIAKSERDWTYLSSIVVEVSFGSKDKASMISGVTQDEASMISGVTQDKTSMISGVTQDEASMIRKSDASLDIPVLHSRRGIVACAEERPPPPLPLLPSLY